MSVILTVESLNKSYEESGNKVTVLKNINLKIESGEFVSIMGPSGSGKSTLLYCISGMENVTSGKVFLDNNEINKMKEDEKSKFRLLKEGFVFQRNNMLRNLSILDNILLPGYISKSDTRENTFQYCIDLMTKTGIYEIRNRNINEVSGGQLQRAAICRALINRPKIIFADEPTGSLNSKSSEAIMEIFGDLNVKGNTILVVTHDLKVAAKTDKVIFINDGEVISNIVLGKYIDKNISMDEREKVLSDWLYKNGL